MVAVKVDFSSVDHVGLCPSLSAVLGGRSRRVGGCRPLPCQVHATRSLRVACEVRRGAHVSGGVVWFGSLLYFSAVHLLGHQV